MAPLALWSDTDIIRRAGRIAPGWESDLPNRSLPFTSTIVFVAWKGNPKNIRDWPDLLQSRPEGAMGLCGVEMPDRTEAARKPTREQLAAAVGTRVPDLLAPGLRAVFCGINPSLYSAAVGHHFARPGNRFWPAIHIAGFTDRLLSPSEDRLLLDYGYGLTNIAGRATATADQVPDLELSAGARTLSRKLRKYVPRAIAFLGVGAYRVAFRKPKAVLGRQPDHLCGAEVWVLPNPSGLNAHYRLNELAQLYRALRDAVSERSGPE